jgi:hypothetical protein
MNVRAATSVIAGTAFALLVLTGCAPAQTTTEACTILKTGLENVSTELSEAAELLASDPTAAAAGIDDAAENYKTTLATITDDTVRAPATASSDAVTNFSDAVGVLAADFDNADPDALTGPLEAVQVSFAGLNEVCSLG